MMMRFLFFSLYLFSTFQNRLSSFENDLFSIFIFLNWNRTDWCIHSNNLKPGYIRKLSRKKLNEIFRNDILMEKWRILWKFYFYQEKKLFINLEKKTNFGTTYKGMQICLNFNLAITKLRKLIKIHFFFDFFIVKFKISFD